MFSLWSTPSQVTIVCFMYMQHITTLQAQGMYMKSPDTTQHIIIAHRKDRAERNSPARLPCPAVQGDIVVSFHVHAAYQNTASPRNISPDTTQHTFISHRKGRAERNSPPRLPSPAVLTCQADMIATVHVHAACHSTASSQNVW